MPDDATPLAGRRPTPRVPSRNRHREALRCLSQAAETAARMALATNFSVLTNYWYPRRI